MSKGKDRKFLEPTQIKKGEVRNPNGCPKGMKNARTIVREFMDKEIDSISGTKVTRFQYTLWSMYEITVRLEKQATVRENFMKDSQAEYLDAKALFERGEIQEKDFNKKVRAYKKDSTDYETLLVKIQDSNIKLSEFFLKASGQYKEEIGINSPEPVTIEVQPEDIKEAAKELEGEF